jgi:hypothetical protein
MARKQRHGAHTAAAPRSPSPKPSKGSSKQQVDDAEESANAETYASKFKHLLEPIRCAPLPLMHAPSCFLHTFGVGASEVDTAEIIDRTEALVE